MTKPESKDLSHFLSAESKRRNPSPLKEAFVHTRNPNIYSLGGGLPLPSLFPYEKVSAKTLAPPFKEGIDKNILEAEDTIDVEVFKRPSDEHEDVDLSTSLQYGLSDGDLRLRGFIREHTKKVHDIGYSDWDVVLTVGNTFALDATLRTFCNPGDVILAEEFSFSSALATMEAIGVVHSPVPMDLEGIIPEALEEKMANWVGPKPRLLYTIPTGQNPTGSTLSAERRRKVYDIMQKYDILIVEDEPYYYLQMPKFSAEEHGSHEELTRESFIKSLVPSFMDFDTDGRVIRLDSFSKVLAPGTRIGWIVAQKRFLERYLRLLEVTSQVPSGFSQSLVQGVLTRWGQDGYLDWLMELRKVYTGKRDLTCETIERVFPKGKFEFSAPTAGMFFWIKIDARKHKKYDEFGRDPIKIEMEMYNHGLENGVLMAPGHWFVTKGETIPPQPTITASEDEKNAMFFRGSFAAVPADRLVGALERWAKTMNEDLV